MLRQFRINLLFLVSNIFEYSSKNNTTSSEFENSFFDFFLGKEPGLYEIYCKVNKKRYIGEAVNVLDRLGKHSRSLLAGENDCTSLQHDWNTYGPDQFEAHILYCGPEWEERKKRLAKENEIICTYEPDQVYNEHPNFLPEKEDNYRYINRIHGVRYESVNEASLKTGEKATRISVKLRNRVPGYEIIAKVKHGYEPIIGNGKHYDSIRDAVDDGQARDRFHAYRLLKNPKRKDWNYLSPEKRIKKDDT